MQALLVLMLMNYADYVELEPKLVMLMFSIALYVMFKCSTTSSKVEGLDGGSVAFDKDAFTNLNKLVSALVNNEETRIPGNLVVDGTITVKDTNKKGNNITGATNITGTTTIKGETFIGSVENTRMRIKDGKIGNKQAGDIEFGNGTDDWKRCYKYDTKTYARGIAGNEFWCDWSSGGRSTMRVGRLEVDNIVGYAWGENKINVNAGITFCTGDKDRNDLQITNNFYNQPCVITNTRGVFNMNNGAYTWINASDGKCYIRGHIMMDGNSNSGRDIQCGSINTHSIYTWGLDVDTLKGHAWRGNGYKNTIRLEDHFALRNDHGSAMYFSGASKDDEDKAQKMNEHKKKIWLIGDYTYGFSTLDGRRDWGTQHRHNRY